MKHTDCPNHVVLAEYGHVLVGQFGLRLVEDTSELGDLAVNFHKNTNCAAFYV